MAGFHTTLNIPSKDLRNEIEGITMPLLPKKNTAGKALQNTYSVLGNAKWHTMAIIKTNMETG